MADRAVTRTDKDVDGDITRLCNQRNFGRPDQNKT